MALADRPAQRPRRACRRPPVRSGPEHPHAGELAGRRERADDPRARRAVARHVAGLVRHHGRRRPGLHGDGAGQPAADAPGAPRRCPSRSTATRTPRPVPSPNAHARSSTAGQPPGSGRGRERPATRPAGSCAALASRRRRPARCAGRPRSAGARARARPPPAAPSSARRGTPRRRCAGAGRLGGGHGGRAGDALEQPELAEPPARADGGELAPPAPRSSTETAPSRST